MSRICLVISLMIVWILAGCGYIAAAVGVAVTQKQNGSSGSSTVDARVPSPTRSRTPDVVIPVTIGPHTVALVAEFLPRANSTTALNATLKSADRGTIVGNTIVGLEASLDTVVTLVWDSAADLRGPGVNVSFRVTAIGPTGPGHPTDYGPVTVGDSAPQAEMLRPTASAVVEGNTVIQIRLVDNESDPANISLEYVLPGQAPRPCTLAVAAPLTQIQTRPAAEGGAIVTFVWNSSADLPGLRVGNVELLVVPDDGNPAMHAEPARDFVTVNNNQIPVATLADFGAIQDQVFAVGFDYTVVDSESDRVDAVVQWRRDGQQFPDLHQFGDLSDPAARSLVLKDPAKRAILHAMTEIPRIVAGRVPAAGIGSDAFLAPELFATGRNEDVVGQTVELLRRAPESITVAAQVEHPAGQLVHRSDAHGNVTFGFSLSDTESQGFGQTTLQPLDVAVGDVNGDNTPDAIAPTGTNLISVFQGN